MKSSFSDMFAMVFTFLHFLHFLRFYIFLHFYISLQGIAFAVKAPPATGFSPVAGGAVKYGIQLSQISIPIHRLLSR